MGFAHGLEVECSREESKVAVRIFSMGILREGMPMPLTEMGKTVGSQCWQSAGEM